MERNEYDVIEIPINVFNIINKDAKIIILLSMEYQDIIHLCSTDKFFVNFCERNKNRIWKDMIKRDFDMTLKNEENYLKIYKDLLQAKEYYEENKYRSIRQLLKDKHNNYFGIKWLIEAKKINPSANFDEALKYASYYGYTEIVKLLLFDKRANPSNDDNEAIRLASDKGHIEIVKLLLNDPIVDPSDYGNGAIVNASSSGHIEIVKLLLNDKRIDPSYDDNDLVKTAKLRGQMKIVELLLEDPRVVAGLTEEEIIELRNY